MEASDRHTVLIIPNDPLPLVRTVLIDPVSVTWHSAENIYRLSLDLEKVKLFPSNLELELPFSLNCPCSSSNVSSEFSLFFIQFFNYNELQIPFNSYVVYLKKIHHLCKFEIHNNRDMVGGEHNVGEGGVERQLLVRGEGDNLGHRKTLLIHPDVVQAVLES